MDSETHISKLTAKLPSGRVKTAALKYCTKYKCSTIESLKGFVMNGIRPHGVGVKTRYKLLAAIGMKLIEIERSHEQMGSHL